MQLDRRTAVILVIGVVGMSALVLSAATLTEPAAEATGGGWINPGPSEDSGGQIFSDPLELPIPSLYLDVLWTALWVGSMVFLLISIVFIDSDEIVRGAILLFASVAIMGVLGVIFSDLTMASLDTAIGENVSYVSNSSLPSFSTGESASPGGGVSPYLLGSGALVVSIVVGVMYFRSGDEAALDAPEEADNAGEEEQLSAIGEAAGRAADGIEASDVAASNAVYQAWVEMTAALDVAQPATTTPGEFAEAAVEAGMDPEHVRELTALFEEVRYGGASVSDERVERARAALRRIETTYAGDEP